VAATFYRLLVRAARLLGPWFFVLVAKTVATGFFFLSAPRRAVGRDFYRALFPGKPQWYYNTCTWRQFLNFTYLYLDRFIQREIRELAFTIEGRCHIDALRGKNRGAILLMSHMGNWEVAAHLLPKMIPGLRLLLYMGIREKEEIEKLQKQSIRHDGIRIIGMERQGGSPFEIVEGIRFLEAGGFVSMAGDVLWRGDERTFQGSLLGRRVEIPQAPFLLSLVSGAPLIVFFAFRTEGGAYHFQALPPIFITPPTRQGRTEALQAAAGQYLAHLEHALRRHPFQWYHFDAFLQTPP
jgi:predicted LPLAT superfamily acyltransferase